MKVLFLTIGDKSVASSRVRVNSYLPYLHREGIKAFIMHYTPSWQCRKISYMKKQNFVEKIVSKLYSMLMVLFLFIAAPFFDVIYIQKVILSRFSIKILKILNGNIVFDFDDSLFLYNDIGYLLKDFTCVIVSNKYLKEFASRYSRRVYELVTPVEVDGHHFQKDGDSVTLGWIGSPQTSKFLYQVVPIFKSLKERFKDLKIEFMGINKNKDFELLLGIKTTEWSLEEEKRFLERISIGIMPLLHDESSKGKCGYKLLQYMANGIPCVASPIGINKEIVKNGINGFLVDTPDEWLDKLSLLISNASLRQEMGQRGLELVEGLYSYRVTAPRLIEILRCIAGRDKKS